MKFQPFVVLGEAHLACLQKSLTADLHAWGEAWFADSIGLNLSVRSIIRDYEKYREVRAVKVSCSAAEQWAVYSIDSIKSERVGALMLGNHDDQSRPSSPNSLIHEVVRRAFLRLVQRLLGAKEDEVFTCTDEEQVQNCMPADAFRPGREALQLSIDLGGVSFLLWLPVIPLLPRFLSSTGHVVEGQVEFVPAREALENQRLTAQVVLGEAELTVGALANLKVGDVIRLDKELQEPLSLVVEKSSAMFGGYLGRQDEHLAFRVETIRT